MGILYVLVVGVECLDLGKIAVESGDISPANAAERADLENIACTHAGDSANIYGFMR